MSLGKNILYTFLTQIPVVILSVITGIFITRYLGVEYKGIFSFFESDIILLTLFTGFGMDTAISFYLSKKQHDVSKILGASILVLIATIIFLFLLLFSLIHISPDNFLFPTDFDSWFYYIYLFVAVVLSLLNSYFSAIYRGLKKFSLVNKVTLVNTIVALMAFAVLYFNAVGWIYFTKLENVLLIKLGVLIFLNLIWFIVYLQNIKQRVSFRIDRNLFKGIFGFISIIYMADLLNFFNYRLDLYFIEFYLTDTDLSYYSLAVNIAQFFWIFTASLTTVLQPSLNDPHEKKVFSKFVFYSRINFTIVLAGCLILFFISSWLIPFVYGKDFSGTVPALQILLPAILVSSTSKMFAFKIFNEGRVNYNLISTAIAVVVTITLNFLLIPYFGILGAAVSTLISYSTAFSIMYFQFTVLLKQPNCNYFFLRRKDINKSKFK